MSNRCNVRPPGPGRYEEDILRIVLIPILLKAFAFIDKFSVFASKLSEIYFRKMRPRMTFLYSDASMFPRRTHAASHISFSKPISAVFIVVFSPFDYYSPL